MGKVKAIDLEHIEFSRILYQSPMGKVKESATGFASFAVNAGYQSPMGKVKQLKYQESNEQSILYQSPMGKVKRHLRNLRSHRNIRINPLWVR